MKKQVLSLLTALLFFSSAMWATDPDYLSFTATGSGSGINRFFMRKNGSPNALNLQYSTDKTNWQDMPTSTETTATGIPIANGTTLYVRTKSTESKASIGNIDADNCWSFYIAMGSKYDTVVVSGNIMSLLDQSCELTTLEEDYVFVNLFGKNSNSSGGMKIGDLKLPATTLSKGCYQGMFNAVKLIRSGSLPALPATTLAEDCYREMFKSVNNLKIAIPANYLPAQSLAKGCYRDMFAAASGFTSAPTLPATELAESCYRGMFASAKFSELPALPATELAPYCYDSMFLNVNTNLTSIPKDYLPAMVMKEGCYRQMFKQCYKVTQLPNLPATTLAKDCYNTMFYSCGSNVGGLQNVSIDLPATELVEGCYNNMFQQCTYPTISVHFTSWGDDSYTTNWLYNYYYGKFYGPQALIDDLDRIGRSTSTYPSPALYSSGLVGGNLYVLPDIFVLSDNVDNTYVLSNALDKEQNIQLRRTFQAGMWNTICLPFALDASQIAAAFGAGTKVGTMTRAEMVNEELILDFNTNVTAMEAGKPYIIFPGANENVVNPTFEGVTITTTEAGVNSSDNFFYKFVGTFSPVTDLDETDNLFLGVNNTVHPISGGTLNGFRAYFELNTTITDGEEGNDAPADAPTRIRLVINGAEETTAMDEMEMLNPAAKMIENGQVVIIKNGAKYNVFGQQL